MFFTIHNDQQTQYTFTIVQKLNGPWGNVSD